MPAEREVAQASGGTAASGAASLDQAYLERQDRNGDGLLCVRIVTPSSAHPGSGIPAGETNLLVLTVDNPGGHR